MDLRSGVIDGYLYINGVKQTAYQVVKFEGDYYFVYDGNKVAKNTTLYLSETYTNGTGLTAGYYCFDDNGVLSAKEGVDGDFLYINGVRQTAYRLVSHGGYYYFINDGHKIARNTKVYLSAKFVEGTGLAVGYYEFDANGHLIEK